MAKEETALQFSPSDIASLVVGVIFLIWGWFWPSPIGGIVFLLLTTAMSFLFRNWGRLPVAGRGGNVDSAMEQAGDSFFDWLVAHSDVWRVLGVAAVGGVGISLVTSWAREGEGFFYTIGTWGGNPEILIGLTSAGVAACLAGLVQYKLSGERQGWGAQLTSVGMSVTLATAAVPVFLILFLAAACVWMVYIVVHAIFTQSW